MGDSRPVTFLLFAIMGLCMGCCQRHDYATARRNGITEVELIRSFDGAFPNAVHEIAHYTGMKGATAWNAEAIVYGRYHVWMKMEIHLDLSGKHIVSHGEPTFYLDEFASIEPDENGNLLYKLAQAPIRPHPTAEDLRKVLDAHGDLSVLGKWVKKDAPVPNADAYWAEKRKQYEYVYGG